MSTGAHTYGIGVIDVTPPAARAQSDSADPAAARRDLLKSVIPMPGGAAQMWGMSWDPFASLLKSVQQSATEPTLDWRTLDPLLAPAQWHSRALGASAGFTSVGGNLESVRAFDCSAGPQGERLFVIVSKSNEGAPHIGTIDASEGQLLSASPALSGDTGWSGSVLLQLAMAPKAC